MEAETVYSADPLSVALRWEAEGAKRLHVVDLDGAVQGRAANRDLIRRILEAVRIPIQVGGGIRRMDILSEYIDAGAFGVVLGTSVVMDRSFAEEACRRYPGRLLAGVDLREGKVAVQGWTAAVERPWQGLLAEVASLGFAAVILTDIRKDGMLQGPNISLLEQVVAETPLPVIASGGVGSREDIGRLAQIPELLGTIVGKALYSGDLTLQDALSAAGG